MLNVLIIQEHLPEFRVPFYERLRAVLMANNINLQLVYAPNQRNTFLRGTLDRATAVPIHWFGLLAWQPVLDRARKADLVIVQQESKYAVNPLLQVLAKCGGTPVAYWGHGQNFQLPLGKGLTSSLKNFLATKVHWWFAYNDLSAAVVRGLGYPENRITSVGNAIDTTGLIERKKSITRQEIVSVHVELGLNSENLAVYTGGIYSNKRIKFLLASAILIRAAIPDFELIVIGDGPERNRISAAASRYPWIHDVGPKSDHAKVPYWALAKLLLMPGGVGLVILDSFALGVPLVTTDSALHGPEIDYLKNHINGLMVPCGNSHEIYATAVADLLMDTTRLEGLRAGGLASSAEHTIEKMSANFAAGVILALDQPQA